MDQVNNKEAMIDEFVATLVHDKGLDDLDSEVVAQLRADLKDRLNDRVNAAILKNLPPDQMEVFADKLEHVEKGKEEELDAYISEQIPDLKKVLAKELLAFRAAYLYS